MVYGERNIKVAETMQYLATVLDSQGLLSEAAEYLSQALAIEEQVRSMCICCTCQSVSQCVIIIIAIYNRPTE